MHVIAKRLRRISPVADRCQPHSWWARDLTTVTFYRDLPFRSATPRSSPAAPACPTCTSPCGRVPGVAAMSAGAEAAESASTSSPSAATELPPAPNGPAFVTPASYLRPPAASRPSQAPKVLTPTDKEQIEALVRRGSDIRPCCGAGGEVREQS